MTQPGEDEIPEQPAPPAEEVERDEDVAEWDEEIETGEETQSACRCGECCRHLIIEVGLDDANREPKIKEHGSPIYAPGELTATGQPELEGYLLNSPENGDACAFLDQTTNLCSIYETRPWACRVFDCDGEGKEQLIQLGIKPGSAGRSR